MLVRTPSKSAMSLTRDAAADGVGASPNATRAAPARRVRLSPKLPTGLCMSALWPHSVNRSLSAPRHDVRCLATLSTASGHACDHFRRADGAEPGIERADRVGSRVRAV